MNRKTLLLAAALFLAPAVTTASPVYKWTDENGVTHFGDRQPSGGQAKPISLRTLKVSEDSGSEHTSPQERLQELETRQATDSENARLQAQQEALNKQRKANCATAGKNIRILRSKGRIHVKEDGEQRYLTPEEIAEQLKNFEAIASENCSTEN